MPPSRSDSCLSGAADGPGEIAFRKVLPTVAILTAALVFNEGVAAANPSPGLSWEDGGFSILQTAELVLQNQTSTSDDSSTVLIIYGGPSLVYSHVPEDHRGAGMGTEAGIELRRQFWRRSSGPFTSLYAGAGALWPFSGSEASSVIAGSFGMKTGWRIPVSSGTPGFDIEPYTAAAIGVAVAGEPAVSITIYLGLKFALY
jgi:hypothetical protein